MSLSTDDKTAQSFQSIDHLKNSMGHSPVIRRNAQNLLQGKGILIFF